MQTHLSGCSVLVELFAHLLQLLLLGLLLQFQALTLLFGDFLRSFAFKVLHHDVWYGNQ